MSSPLLEAKDLRFRYKGQDAEIRIPNFALDAGESLLVYGRSGTGKSTLLHLVSGLVNDYRGALRFEGQELKELVPSQMDQLRHEAYGNIYQNFNLLPYLNVLENVTLPADLRGLDLRKRAEQLMAHMGLKEFAERQVSALSIGQQQRVAAVRALLMKPRLLLADEPTSSLDAHNKKLFMDLLFEMCRAEGTALLFVSHDPELQSLFDRRLELSAPEPAL
jgi:putative ABC transport system ATP-binding protein